MKDTPAIILPDDFALNALAVIQEKSAALPEVITSKKEFQAVYDQYQFNRKFRIAIEKKSKELVLEYKKVFEVEKKAVTDEEWRVLDIVGPLEKKLLDTRNDWEEKEKKIAEEKSATLAAEQEKEFNRTDIIKKWDQAHLENQAHDQKILDDIEREKKYRELEVETARLKKEKEEFEAKQLEFKKQVDEFEAYGMDDDFNTRIADDILSPAPEPDNVAGLEIELIGNIENDTGGHIENIELDEEEINSIEKKGIKVRAPTQTRLEQMLDDEQEQDCIEGEARCPECGHKFNTHSY